MGLFDDAVPGGNIAKPLLIALGVLLAGKVFSSKTAGESSDNEALPPASRVPDRRSPQADAPIGHDTGSGARPTGKEDGGLLDGLGDLLDNLAKTGQRETADSWVGPGDNKPIQPGELGKAIGDTTLRTLARRTGMSEEELLTQLSKVLPGLVDKLTPQGKVPSNREVAENFPKSPW
jgi:uncharacterized protein YidB (DUF937 family)